MDLYEDLNVFSGNAQSKRAKPICLYLGIPLGASKVFKFSNDDNVDKTNGRVLKHHWPFADAKRDVANNPRYRIWRK